MFFCQHHRRIKADNREISRNMQNLPDNLFTSFGVEKVNLRGIVPRQPRPVVTVINVSSIAAMMVDPFKHHRAVRF